MPANQIANLQRHYIYQNSIVKLILNEFTKPIHMNIFFRNIDYLSLKCDLVKFNNNKWIYQPNLFCQDKYDEPYLSPVIMMINNIGSFFDFIPSRFISEKILCPKYEEIIDVLNLPNL